MQHQSALTFANLKKIAVILVIFLGDAAGVSLACDDVRLSFIRDKQKAKRQSWISANADDFLKNIL